LRGEAKLSSLPKMSAWKPSACILCECNCGIEVELGGDDGRHLVKIRGDKTHPSSRGYACEKAHRLDHYQHGRDRILSPLRRRSDGTFEEIDWDTAIREVAARLASVRDTHGGDSIFYYGGGGQGNHLPGAYATATRRALESRYRSSALAQEKTGEFWVSDRTFGSSTRADFEHCDVALFIGKNPWHSHSIPRARVTLKEIAKDPARTLIVIDPRRTETAELADIHCGATRNGRLAPRRDFGSARRRRPDRSRISRGARGGRRACDRSASRGSDRKVLRDVRDRRGARSSHGARPRRRGSAVHVRRSRRADEPRLDARQLSPSLAHRAHGKHRSQRDALHPDDARSVHRRRVGRTTPVAGAPIVAGLVPCNVIADEILTDHPKRYRAMIVEAATRRIRWPTRNAYAKRFVRSTRSS